jgi:hypothetical protein
MDAANKEGTPKQLRGRSLGTGLSEPEYAQCERAAARREQSLSEWCRHVEFDTPTFAQHRSPPHTAQRYSYCCGWRGLAHCALQPTQTHLWNCRPKAFWRVGRGAPQPNCQQHSVACGRFLII